jgi:mRNA-degrading endonuclease RelE of RelBE toxin-antitoxin system
MIHKALPRFWKLYNALPEGIQDLADKNFALLKANPQHPSLGFKKIANVDGLWAARVGDHYRVLAREGSGGMTWFWIGSHEEYNKLIR